MSTTSPKTIPALAGDLYRALEARTREGSGETFYALRDGSPDWMAEAVREAHGDMLPDDWRYEAIWAVSEALSDLGADEDHEDAIHEIADGLVDVYTANLTKWLASSLERVAYVDEAREDFGGEGNDLETAIKRGQFLEYREIASSLVSALAALVDEDSDEDEG